MRAHTLPAAAGWRWLIGGFALYRRNPPLLSMLALSYCFSYLLLQLFAMVVPIVGALLASLVMPGLWVGLMQGCRDLERGEAAGLPTLFAGIRQNPRVLMLLGLFSSVAVLAAFGLTSLYDGGELFQAMAAVQQPNQEAMDSASLLPSMLILMLLVTPVLMAYWFAPLLAAWHGQPLAKSLFFSFISCLFNWRAFLVYGLALLAVAFFLPLVITAFVAALFPAAQNFLSALIAVPVILVVMPSVFASFYVSYRDIFVSGVSESA